MKLFTCIFILSLASVFAKTDTTTVVNCKCDTVKIVVTSIDTTVVTKIDTLKNNLKPTKKK